MRVIQAIFLSSFFTLAACQHNPTQPKSVQLGQTTVSQNTPVAFKISGKIGVVYVDSLGKKQSGSAFFAWVQENKRFAIDLTGALGVGKTYIEGTPSYAKLVNQHSGEIIGDTPEDILYQATKWHAPISMLPNWIMARPTKHHMNTTYDQFNRLQSTQESNWRATLSYKENEKFPYKIKMHDDLNNKVIITLQTRH